MLMMFFLIFVQDGRIDYNEFVTMMKKGVEGGAGIGSRTMRGNLNFNLAEVLGATDSAGLEGALDTLKVEEVPEKSEDASASADT